MRFIPWDKIEKKHLHFGKSTGTSFPNSSYKIVFWLFQCYGILMGRPMHVLVTKQTMWLESDWKETPILWKNSGYQFPRFSPMGGFARFLPCYGILNGKPMYIPRDELYHRIKIWWNKSTHTYTILVSISQVLPIRYVLLPFPCYRILMGRPIHSLCDKANHWIGIWWQKTTHTLV